MINNIRTVATQMAREMGLINVTRDELCARAGIPSCGATFRAHTGQSFTEFIDDLALDILDDLGIATAGRRATPKIRKLQILSAAVALANELGEVELVQVNGVAEAAGVTRGSVLHHFGTKKQLHRAIRRHLNANA